MAAKRIGKELEECHKSPPAGMTISTPDDDLHRWDIRLVGPANSPYAGGVFKLSMVLPADYPFKAPKVTFATRIYHPNVTNDEQGSICLSMLKTEVWKPACRIRGVLEAVRQLLVEPQPDDPLETRIADEFKNDRPSFDKAARQYVKQYASSS